MATPRLPHFWLVALSAAASFSAGSQPTDGFPRLWGPDGDGRAHEELRLAAGGSVRARELWRRPIGSGFSGIAVQGGRVYTAMADGGSDHVLAFDAADGRELWRATLGPTYKGHDGSYDGPISTPTLDGDRLFLVGPHGTLVAVDAGTGRVAWRHDLVKDFAAATPVYGFGTSPLVVDGRVIVHVGGPGAHHVAAFEAATGARVWSARPAERAVYSSPVLASLGGRRYVVGAADDKLFGLDPATGVVAWSHPLGWSGEMAKSPLVLPGGRVLVSSWDESAMVSVERDGEGFRATELWRTPFLKHSYSPTVHLDGALYGFNGSYLLCLDAGTGEVRWRQRVYGGSLLLAGRHLLVLGEKSGELRIVDADPASYRERARVDVFNPGATSTTGPSLAAGRVYVRNLEEMMALEIGG